MENVMAREIIRACYLCPKWSDFHSVICKLLMKKLNSDSTHKLYHHLKRSESRREAIKIAQEWLDQNTITIQNIELP